MAAPEPIPASERFRARLPAEPNRLIGRGADVARVETMLGAGRLVGIVGPPGIGKTRLALRVAHRAAEGAYFCELAEARDSAGLFAAVARGLGVALGSQPLNELGRRLGALGDAVVVLDNLEQIVDEAAPAIEAWLDLATSVRFVVTSRERLRLPAEQVVELEPLGVSGADGDDAQELLVERVRARRPDYDPDTAERASLAELAERLDGIPLALELAAARVELLGATEVVSRLTEPLDVLSRGARGADRRQATLRGAIDASWQLLSEDEREALARAAVFRGGFTLDAAEAVIGSGALDVVQSLRDRSLLRAPEPGRFDLYLSVRAFASEQLSERPTRGNAEERHRRYYLALGEAEARGVSEEGTKLDRLFAERNNLLAVFERAISQGDPESATRAVLALGPVLAARGPARFHHELLERARACRDESGTPHDPRLLLARGTVLRGLGELDAAEDDLKAALSLGPIGALEVSVHKELGVTYQLRRDIDSARACYEAALPKARELGDRLAEATLVANLGALDHDIGHFEAAARRYAEGLEGFRAVGDRRLEGITLTNLGVLEHEQGRAKAARSRYRLALELTRESGDHRYEAITLYNLGVLEHEASELVDAEGHLEGALALLVELADLHSEVLCRARLGAVLADRGEVEAGARAIERAERRVAGRAPLALALVQLHRAFLELAEGSTEAARRRVADAQAARGEDEDAPSLVEINDDARLLLRVLGRRLADASGPCLTIGPEARWFEAPGAKRRSLERFAAARRILDHLARERLAQPGRGVSGQDLFAAGWPGVTIAPQSANNRLYVALAKLRKMGLKVFILRDEQGYFLDPSTPLVRGED